MARQRVVSDEMARLLERKRLISSVVGNKRKVSVAALTPPSSRSSSSTSTSTANPNVITADSFGATAIRITEPELTLPLFLESEETFAYIGFDDSTAKKLWAQHVRLEAHPMAEDFHMGFFSVAEDHIAETGFDAWTQEDDWRGSLDSLGINRKLQDAIMLVEYADIRFTGSCKFWVLDAIQVNYQALEVLDRDLKKQVSQQTWPAGQAADPGPPRRTAGTFTRMPTSSASSGGGSTHIPAAPSSSSASNLNPPPEPMSADRPAPSGSEPFNVLGKTVEGPKFLEGHIMLWRAGSKVAADEFYNPVTKRIEFGPISARPGDFCGLSVAYWTTQLKTADRYAKWARNKAEQPGTIAVIQVAVPQQPFLSGLKKRHLWYGEGLLGDPWRTLVWHSRNGSDWDKDWAWLPQDTQLVIGHIASGRHRKYIKMNSPASIREQDVLNVGTEDNPVKGIQWVFRGLPARTGFAEACRNTVWIHVVG